MLFSYQQLTQKCIFRLDNSLMWSAWSHVAETECFRVCLHHFFPCAYFFYSSIDKYLCPDFKMHFPILGGGTLIFIRNTHQHRWKGSKWKRSKYVNAHPPAWRCFLLVRWLMHFAVQTHTAARIALLALIHCKLVSNQVGAFRRRHGWKSYHANNFGHF